MSGPLTADRTCPSCHRLVSYQGHADDCRAGGAGVTREAIVAAILAELARAQSKFGPIASAHEAIGVVGEEWDEFDLAVKWGVDHRGEPADPRVEAVQLAAMAIRYLFDVGGLATPTPASEPPPAPEALAPRRLTRGHPYSGVGAPYLCGMCGLPEGDHPAASPEVCARCGCDESRHRTVGPESWCWECPRCTGYLATGRED